MEFHPSFDCINSIFSKIFCFNLSLFWVFLFHFCINYIIDKLIKMLIEKEACLLCIIVCILSICGCLYIIKNILKMEDRGFGGELLGLVSTSYLIYSLLNGLECVFYFENIQINQTNCIILGYLKTFSILAGIMWSSIIACGL